MSQLDSLDDSDGRSRRTCSLKSSRLFFFLWLSILFSCDSLSLDSVSLCLLSSICIWVRREWSWWCRRFGRKVLEPEMTASLCQDCSFTHSCILSYPELMMIRLCDHRYLSEVIIEASKSVMRDRLLHKRFSQDERLASKTFSLFHSQEDSLTESGDETWETWVNEAARPEIITWSRLRKKEKCKETWFHFLSDLSSSSWKWKASLPPTSGSPDLKPPFIYLFVRETKMRSSFFEKGKEGKRLTSEATKVVQGKETVQRHWKDLVCFRVSISLFKRRWLKRSLLLLRALHPISVTYSHVDEWRLESFVISN